MIKMKCQYCKKEFKTYPYNLKIGKGKYCSLKCRNKSYKKRIKLTCKQCYKQFEVTPREFGREFCSNKCHGIYREKNIELICELCKKPFTVKPRYSSRRFCSRECYYKSETKLKIITKCLYCGKEVLVTPLNSIRKKFCSHKCHGLYKTNHVLKTCIGCGKEFTISKHRVIAGRGKYCNLKCKHKHMNKENHPAWKGGLSYIPYDSDFDEVCKEKHRKLWNRKCGICYRKESENIEKWNEKLSVHHINYNKKASCKDKSNLFIPLCKQCHAKTNYNRRFYETYLTNCLMIWGRW